MFKLRTSETLKDVSLDVDLSEHFIYCVFEMPCNTVG